MSDMQFRAVRKRADKSESEKATVSESVARNAKRVGLKSLSPKKAAPHSYRTCTHLRGKPLKTRVSDKGKKTSWGRSSVG
jgi:hypothetical protein